MSRHYLFPEDGDPLRLSQRLVSGLVSGTDGLPEFAETKQRVLSAMLELDAGKPVRIIRTEASIWEFDEQGGIRRGLYKATALAMDSLLTPERAAGETVVELRPRANQAKLQKEYRWEPSKADIERIIADVWPKKKADRLKAAQGVSKRRPPLTYDAKHAIDEISGLFWNISHAIERLKEPSQKGFGFEARERSRIDPEYAHLYRALADMSDWQLEVDRRHRTGKGIWYASVEVILVRDDGIGEAVERHYERCEGRDKAVLAVRRLLVEHASKFSDHTRVEVEMLTDLEWEKRAYAEL